MVARQTICLSMIVKNEVHIVHEALEAVAPYINYWVIVDTGSTDNTQDVIRTKMAELGVPGELHERPWRDFASNRSEAVQLAQGHSDYIWVMDADDTVIGKIDFSGLTADGYNMRSRIADLIYWRPLLLRDGVTWNYVGVVHELPVHNGLYPPDEMLYGDYEIIGRHLGARSSEPGKYERDRDLLLAQLGSDPDDSRSAFFLAQTYNSLGDQVNAKRWYARRSEMGGFDQEVYYSMLKLARAMDATGEPWTEVLNAYLRAWDFRPVRAEPLYDIAFHYRQAGQYELGYLFARRGAEIQFPDSDVVFVEADVYNWRLLDEQSVCASWIGRKVEALKIDRRLLTRDDLPDDERERIMSNRDSGAAQLMDACGAYPADKVDRPVSRQDAEITVTLTTGADKLTTELTLNSFLRCCSDSARVGRFLIVDTGLNARDREALASSYNFSDFITLPTEDLNSVCEQIGGRYWLHLGHGWRFFTDEALLSRLIDVLECEPEVYQVGINLKDATELSAKSPARSGVRTTPRANRYLLTDTETTGPAMFDMTRFERVFHDVAGRPPRGRTATLDEVLCVHTP